MTNAVVAFLFCSFKQLPAAIFALAKLCDKHNCRGEREREGKKKKKKKMKKNKKNNNNKQTNKTKANKKTPGALPNKHALLRLRASK